MTRDRLTAEVHAFVLARDLACVLYKFDRTHICADRWGRSHSPYDLSKLTVDHVKAEPMMGRRAPSEPASMVAMCWMGNVRGPSKAVRLAERSYLASLYPETVPA